MRASLRVPTSLRVPERVFGQCLDLPRGLQGFRRLRFRFLRFRYFPTKQQKCRYRLGKRACFRQSADPLHRSIPDQAMLLLVCSSRCAPIRDAPGPVLGLVVRLVEASAMPTCKLVEIQGNAPIFARVWHQRAMMGGKYCPADGKFVLAGCGLKQNLYSALPQTISS